jgi:hypothetical protein
MINRITLFLGVLLTASFSLSAQDQNVKPKKTSVKTTAVENDKDKVSVEAEKERKAMMDYMTPGPMHKMLMSANGEWTEYITLWRSPGALAESIEATCTNKMILGDLYQESIHKGMMMGMPFEGRGTCGYDNAKKVFQSTWVDNMGSGIMFLEGKYDETSKAITMKGKMIDPATGKTENVREVLKFVDNNLQLMEMYVTKNGKEFKNMEIKLSRKSEGGEAPKK